MTENILPCRSVWNCRHNIVVFGHRLNTIHNSLRPTPPGYHNLASPQLEPENDLASEVGATGSNLQYSVPTQYPER